MGYEHFYLFIYTQINVTLLNKTTFAAVFWRSKNYTVKENLRSHTQLQRAVFHIKTHEKKLTTAFFHLEMLMRILREKKTHTINDGR